ncbi:LAETG motif-containing sortase-dependent surface protein [Streptomyces sp. NPDC054775]
MRADLHHASGVFIAALAAAFSLAGATVAHATPSSVSQSENCGPVKVQFSVDAGKTWSDSGRLTGNAPSRFTVRLDFQSDQADCTYNVSLAAYSAQGPDWETSGTQALVGWDSVALSAAKPSAVLNVSDHLPSCFGQIDLYGNGEKYDGTNGHALPHFPDSVTPNDLITVWNGTTPCASASASPSPSESASTTPSGASTPTPSATHSGGSAPSGTPQVPAAGTTTAVPSLAETGGSGDQDVALVGSGAAVIVIGAGAIAFARRRRELRR